MHGMWQRYYQRWRNTTQEHVDQQLLELMPPLARLVPPATAIDKTRYSFVGSHLLAHLRDRQSDGLIVTGSETDVCVLSSVLGAVDLGYRVIVVRTLSAAHPTRDTRRCSRYITAVTASRSKRRMPKTSCAVGNNGNAKLQRVPTPFTLGYPRPFWRTLDPSSSLGQMILKSLARLTLFAELPTADGPR